jgi:glutathione S-transferase
MLRVFGSELSPYSVKVRSYLRFKGIPHEWIPRNQDNMDEYRKYAKLPLIPLVVTPDGEGLQDSTPILEHFERLEPEPGVHPADPTLAFLSALLEEYGDEWGNKPMFHYRWTYEADQRSAAERIARENLPRASAEQLAGAIEMIKGRMVPRLRFVGSAPETREPIEGSFLRQLALLEAHLAARPYLFGGRPVFADFGVFPQLYECLTDPTPGALLRERAPRVVAWLERMLSPRAQGDLEGWDALEATLLPFLREEVGGIFFPWTLANARALAAGEKTFRTRLGAHEFTQETQKYHAKSLAALRARYAALPERARLDAILARCACLEPLRGGEARG